MSSVFVQLPSYHDFELPKTIINALDQSSGSHTINFGVHHAFYKKNEIYIPNFTNITKIEVEAPTNMGLGIARNIANSFYNGEDYYLQIDSHSRFDKNWDLSLISYVKEFQACGVKKPLLSTYPGIYSYTERLDESIEYSAISNYISFTEFPEKFAETLIPSQKAVHNGESRIQSSISGGYIFSTGEFSTVGFNDKVAFWGEEILIAAMAWTRGFDLLIPPKPHIYHLYYNSKIEFQRNGRRHVWNDFPELWQAMDIESKKEVKDILSTGRVGPQALGTERSLDDYGVYAGLDFKNKIVTQ
jgi:hypothetical protein